jgi:hypothetical protein
MCAGLGDNLIVRGVDQLIAVVKNRGSNGFSTNPSQSIRFSVTGLGLDFEPP